MAQGGSGPRQQALGSSVRAAKRIGKFGHRAAVHVVDHQTNPVFGPEAFHCLAHADALDELIHVVAFTCAMTTRQQSKLVAVCRLPANDIDETISSASQKPSE